MAGEAVTAAEDGMVRMLEGGFRAAIPKHNLADPQCPTTNAVATVEVVRRLRPVPCRLLLPGTLTLPVSVAR